MLVMSLLFRLTNIHRTILLHCMHNCSVAYIVVKPILSGSPINFPPFIRQTLSLVPKLVPYIYLEFITNPYWADISFKGTGILKWISYSLLKLLLNIYSSGLCTLYMCVPEGVHWKVICPWIQLKGQIIDGRCSLTRAKIRPASCTIAFILQSSTGQIFFQQNLLLGRQFALIWMPTLLWVAARRENFPHPQFNLGFNISGHVSLKNNIMWL